jgi:MerR family transcriptional regulator, light-induced transcriptional regulator
VIAPERTDSGYRLFDEEAIRRLELMRRVVAAGMTPSVAAAEVLAGRLESVATPAPATGVSAGGAAVESSVDLVDRFVAAASALDEGALAPVIDEMFARGSFERVCAAWLFPALNRMGDAWAAGEVSVAGEHLASNLVQRRLGQLLDAAGAAPSGWERALVGLPPGSRHELGALAFAIAARRAGVPVAYLGADLPLDDWLLSARFARAAVIAVPTRADAAGARRVVEALTESASGVTVAVGGPGAFDAPGAVRLPDRLEDAVAKLKSQVAF